MSDRREEKETDANGFPGFDPKSIEAYMVKDPQALTLNLARALEHLGQAAS